MREAMRALELSVVIDVAMTETARQADYVLPASSQFEKVEATFFNLEFPRNTFHLRAPLFDPLPGTLPEAEIHARLIEAMGELGALDYLPLKLAAKLGRKAFAITFLSLMATRKKIAQCASVVLYRTLGPSLPKGMETAAAIWGICQLHVMANRTTSARAGFTGIPLLAADRLFQAMLDNPSGVVFAESNHKDCWHAVGMKDHRINLYIPEMIAELEKLVDDAPPVHTGFPFILSAGERRSDTSNTAVRDSSWHKKGRYGSLRIHPDDAAALQCADGDFIRIITQRGAVEAPIEISTMMQPGHVSLPNGQGLDYHNDKGQLVRKGIAPNELTDTGSRDFLAGTPWHKFVPARLERIPLSA
jgi:anaerobic selenocysteine-containing dehydrogenase